MVQYAAQVGPRRSEYTEGDIKFDPKTDLTRASISYYLRDEAGNETKLEPTPDGIRKFLSTTDQNTSRAGIRPPLMKNDQFGNRMGRWETPIPLNSDWLCAARWIARMELADPVPAEDRDRTAAFRNPEKPQKPPIKTYTLDKAVIGLIAR